MTIMSTFLLVRSNNILLMNQNINHAVKFKNHYIPRKIFNKLDSKIYYLTGVSKINRYKYLDAIEDFNKALKLNPRDSFAFYKRGYLKFNLNDFNGALDDFDKSLKIAPNTSRTILGRGYARYKLRNYQGACIDFNKVKNEMLIEEKYLKKCE